jgi:hypothetical protein
MVHKSIRKQYKTFLNKLQQRIHVPEHIHVSNSEQHIERNCITKCIHLLTF